MHHIPLTCEENILLDQWGIMQRSQIFELTVSYAARNATLMRMMGRGRGCRILVWRGLMAIAMWQGVAAWLRDEKLPLLRNS